MKRLFVLLCILLLPITIASAHNTGASFEKVIAEGKYKVDVGYDPIQLVAGERAVFDFNIRKMPDLSAVPFDHVWVRIVHEKDTLLATGVAHMPFGPTSLLYVVPRDITGEITVNLRFEHGDTAIAETDFTLPVDPPLESSNKYLSLFLSAISGLLVGAGAAILARKRWR